MENNKMRKWKIYITKYDFKKDKYIEKSFIVTTNRIEEIIGMILQKESHIIKIDYKEIKTK